MNSNKYIKNIKSALVASGIVSIICILPSCTKNFDQYNSNPNNVDTSLLKNDNVGVGAFFPQMEENVIVMAPTPGDGSAYQVCTNLNADLFSGYMGTPTPFGGGQNNSNYAFNSGWDNAAFTVEYNNLIPAWLSIKQNCQTQYPHLYAMANIIKVAGMHRITDIFGPIPYSQVGGGGFSVGFDSQQDIYNSFFSELDSSIATLSAYVQANPGAAPAAKFDLVYQGNFIEWIKLANSLKLRLALHIAYANPSLAQQEAESAVNNTYGVMTANSDNAALTSGNGVTVINPVWVIDQGYGDIRAGAVLQSFLTGYNDPRIATFLQPSTSYPGKFLGIRNGIDIINKSDREGFSSMNISEYQPIQWMNAAEVYFLRAEGALRGWNMGATAQELYETGIQTSFDQWGAGTAASYINDNTSTASSYIDPINNINNVPSGTSYLSTVTIKWNAADNFETSLERIITQKYLAMFPNGQEAWTEFRRTAYPKIWPVVANYSGGTVNTAVQVRRLPYPSQQYAGNNAGVTQGVSQLGGPDNGGTKLWWDKK